MKTFSERKTESSRLLSKYSGHLPVILNKCVSNETLTLDKNKFLIPNDFTFGQLVYVIRKRSNISPEKALFMYLNKNMIASSSDMMSTLYDKYKDEDGFLYCSYATENTFG